MKYQDVFLLAVGGMVMYAAYRVITITNKVDEGATLLQKVSNRIMPEEQADEYDYSRVKDLTP